MNNDKTKCDPCERDFQKNLHNIIREGQAPKGSDHEACEKELKTAFGSDATPKKETTYPTDATASTGNVSKTDHPLGDMPNAERK